MNEWTQGRQPSNTVFRKIQKFKMVDIRETMYMSIQLKDRSKIFFSSFFEIFQATTPYHSKNYLGSFKIEPFCARLCVLLWLVSSYAGAIFIDFGTFFKHADGLQCWTWRFRLMYKCFNNAQFELPIDHYMISSYIEKINISNKANNIYQISEMKNLLHLKGCYFESILTLGLRI